ncbi:MAG: zinc metallopeptidase [Candidatus Pelethousia sp.]|nr:zinc metallopeptidase [Candidatus Pelethousia sp.]
MYGYDYGYGYSEYSGLLLIAVLLVFALGLVAQARVSGTFQKYAKIQATAGIPAYEMASRLLQRSGSSVQVTQVGGRLTDHYNPKTNTVGLSQSVYDQSSVAALAVAAHEIGHVMQYEEGYLPIKLRNAVLPMASIGSGAAPWITLLGVFMGSFNLAMVGVWLFLGILLFQFVTLPVEFNASHRALVMLEDGGYLAYDEVRDARKVLRAAAMTYVVAALSTLVSFLRLLLMAQSTRRRN